MSRSARVWTVLLALAMAQLGTRHIWLPPPVSGPMVGDTLPWVPVRMQEGAVAADLASLTARTTGCAVVFLMSAHCSYCARMRTTWPSAWSLWSDSIKVPVSALWVFREDSVVVARFLDGYDLGSATIATLSGKPDHSWARLGVVGTPMAYLLDGRGIVQSGVLGPQLPSAKRALEVCSGP